MELSNLESKGYIKQEDHNYSLTLSGEEYFDKLYPIVENTQKHLLSNLNNDEISLLEEFLDKLQDRSRSLSE